MVITVLVSLHLRSNEGPRPTNSIREERSDAVVNEARIEDNRVRSEHAVGRGDNRVSGTRSKMLCGGPEVDPRS